MKKTGVCRLIRKLSDDDGGVVTSEAEGVAEGYLDLDLACGVRDIVEVALGIWVVEIDRGRKNPVAHC